MSSLPRGVWASRSALLGVVISDDILVNVLVLDKLQDSQNFIGAVACCKLWSQTKWMVSSHQFYKCIAITKVLCKKHFVSMTFTIHPCPLCASRLNNNVQNKKEYKAPDARTYVFDCRRVAARFLYCIESCKFLIHCMHSDLFSAIWNKKVMM